MPSLSDLVTVETNEIVQRPNYLVDPFTQLVDEYLTADENVFVA